jgi:hypothetical protein
MRIEWGRAKNTRGASIQPVYTYVLVFLSVVATLGIEGFRYMGGWTPLERHYLPAYLGSQVVGVVRENSSYTLLQVITRKGKRLALDSDVHPALTDSGENSFALSEEAVKHGALRLEIHRAHYNNAEMHAYLGSLIYQNQTVMDLVRPALWTGLVLFFAGLLPATYLDQKRSFALRYGKKLRGPELMPPAQLSRRQSSSGMGLVNSLRTILTRVLGSKKELHVPLSKNNPPVLVKAEVLPQEPPKIATAAAGTDSTPRSSGAPQKPTPIKQAPSQDQNLEHAVKPAARRFFE